MKVAALRTHLHRFDATSTYLYYQATRKFVRDAELLRVSVRAPGESQPVGGSTREGGGLAGVVAFAPDEQMVAFSTIENPSALSIVDVSGVEPALLTTIDVPLADGEHLRKGWFSADASVLVFGVRAEPEQVVDLWLVDLSATGGVAPVLASAGDPSMLPM